VLLPARAALAGGGSFRDDVNLDDAVFTGAGIGAAPPASLPLGYALRDRVLELMYGGAAGYAPDLVDEEQLERLCCPERKLEQVLGRLWRVVGAEALECLHCLQVEVPNKAHMLARCI
jgi:hypothetical protein